MQDKIAKGRQMLNRTNIAALCSTLHCWLGMYRKNFAESRELSPHLGVGKNAQLTRPHDPRPSRGNTASTLSIWLEYRKDITLGRLSGANGVDTVHAVESWHQACWRLHTTTADYHMYSISLIKSMMVDFQEMHQHTCVCVCLWSCVSLSLCICVIVFVRVCHCLFPGG